MLKGKFIAKYSYMIRKLQIPSGKTMKRDNEYLRELLFKIESTDDDLFFVPLTLGMAPEERKEHYHVQLLCDEGYMTQINDHAYRLTSEGHDFIGAIRDDGIWENTKKAVAETGGNATIEMLKSIALGLLKTKISKHTGIDV